MAAITVTATEGGATSNGIGLQVKVLNGAKPASGQTGATAHAEAANPDEVSITTTTAGSFVYQAMSMAGTPGGPAAGSTSLFSYTDVTHSEWYAAYRTTSATGTPGAVTAGDTGTGEPGFDNIAVAEILAAATITEDASSPAGLGTDTAATITTASFTPPAGSLLVAMVGTNGPTNGTSLTTMTVTDSSGLTWTELAKSNSTSTCYAGVWIATVPGSGPAAVFPPVPQHSRWYRRRLRRPQRTVPALPQTTASGAAVLAGTGSLDTAFASQQAGATLAGAGSLNSSLTTYITGVSASTSTQAGYFTDNNGQPRLWVCDQVYGLVSHAGQWNGSGGGTWQQDIDNYFSARAAQGVTAVLIEMIAGVNAGGANANGNTWDSIPPFVTGTDPASGLNSSYWTRIDYLLNSALSNGISVFPVFDILYNTTPGGGTCLNGWTNAQYQAFGAAVGGRYKNQPNLMWLFGDDAVPTVYDTQYNFILTGLSGAGDTHPLSVFWSAEYTSRYETDNNTQSSWGASHANFNSCYTYNCGYWCIEYAYGEVANEGATALLPVVWNDGYHFQGGSAYSSTLDRAWRQEIWWCLAAGARGITTYSVNNYNWDSSSAPGTVTTDWSFVHALSNIVTGFTSWTGWNKLLPDLSSSLVTAGRGTRVSGLTAGGSGGAYEPAFTNSWVAASKTPDGTLAVCYLPNSTTITVNTALLATGWTASWVDPITGAATSAGTGPTFNSTAKGANSHGDPDWVLVFQAPLVSTIQGTATLSGTGSLSTAAAQGTAGTVLGGAGSVTDTATQRAGTALGGAGSVTASVTQGAGATLGGAGSVSPGGAIAGAAVLGGAGSVSTAAGGGGGINGTGSLSAGAAIAPPAPLGGQGSLSAGATQGTTGTALGGQGLLSAPAVQQASAALSGQGSLTALSGGGQAGTAALTGTGSLSTAAAQGAGGALAGTGSLSAPAAQGTTGTALAGTGALTAAGAVSTQGAATLGGTGSLSAPAAQGTTGTALAGTGSLTATSGAGTFATATLAGAGSLTTIAGQLSPVTLAGTGSLNAPATAQAAGSALAGAGSLAGTVIQRAGSALAGAGSLAGAGFIAGSVTLAGAGSVGQPPVTEDPAVALAGTAILAAGTVLSQAAALAGTGSLAARTVLSAGTVLAGTGSLTAFGLTHPPQVKGGSADWSVTRPEASSSSVTALSSGTASVS